MVYLILLSALSYILYNDLYTIYCYLRDRRSPVWRYQMTLDTSSGPILYSFGDDWRLCHG